MLSVLTAAQAVALIEDSDTLIVGGNGGTGAAESVLVALEERFLSGAGPHGLTLINITGVGAVTEKGICHLAHEGMIARVIGGNFGLQVPFMRLVRDELIDAYNFPQGVMSQLCRAMAAKHPGVLTHVGIDTYMDPRQDGGRMNARTTLPLVELVEVLGEQWLLYHVPAPPDVAIIRGTSADEDGYISMEHEGTTREDLSIAQAVHNAGGTVICQVKRIVKRGSIHPQMVKIPGFLIDHVVLDPDQMQTYGTVHDPARCGETRVPSAMIVPDPLNARRVIARRAAFELSPRDVVNLGVGISAMIPNVAAEEGIEDLITLTVESGVVGGVPGHAREFGTAINPRAILDQAYQFDFYDGGGLNCAFLSFAELDVFGNVNVTRFGDRRDGSGGFIDITQNSRRLIFNGIMTGGKYDIGVDNGRLDIRRDGPIRKFVPAVAQVSFSASLALHRGQEVSYVTERAVFQLEEGGITLTEVAPGVRLEEDVLAHMAFRPRISPDLRQMDARIFRPGPMGIAARFAEKQRRVRKIIRGAMR